MKKSVLAGLIASVALSATAGAAVAPTTVGKIARIQGTAVVSQGAQYVVATEGMAVREGDRLMALEGGAVTIQFSDGCQLGVSDNEVLTVGGAESCKYGTDPKSAVARGPNAGGLLRQTALEPPTPPSEPPIIGPAVGGVSWLVPVVGLAVVGGAILLADDDDDDRRPPVLSP